MGQFKSKLNVKADPLQCCLTKPPNYKIQELPCQIDWVYEGSPTCEKLIQKYCENKLLKDNFCTKYCFRNEKWCSEKINDKIGYCVIYYLVDGALKSQKFKIGHFSQISFHPSSFTIAPYTSINVFPLQEFMGEPIKYDNNSPSEKNVPMRDITLASVGSLVVSQIKSKNFEGIFYDLKEDFDENLNFEEFKLLPQNLLDSDGSIHSRLSSKGLLIILLSLIILFLILRKL